MDVLDRKDLEQYGLKSAKVYVALCKILRINPGVLSVGRFPDTVDKIILRMTGDAHDTTEFLFNYDSHTEQLFQQLAGPHGYTVYKAWEAKYEQAAGSRLAKATSS